MIATMIFGSLLVVAVWECVQPRRTREFPALRRRLANIGIGLFNIFVAAILFIPPDRLRTAWTLPPVVGFVLGFMALDLWSYFVHRVQHVIPLLWRLHALHHSDPDVDWSTGLRNHPIEALVASGATWAIVLVLAIPGPVVAAHVATAFVMMSATHGNVKWPRWAENLLHPVVITLDLHLVHHSILYEDANANFGQVFSIWDRIFGTFRPAGPVPVFGVRELSRPDACRPVSMLLTPWRIQWPNYGN
jgi:sterol desaturase/sphingolipid hydroxylase (fatty acid hydroxylase superfamily)